MEKIVEKNIFNCEVYNSLNIPYYIGFPEAHYVIWNVKALVELLTAHDAEVRAEGWVEGFELAHDLAKCGHARGNYRDPNYKRGDAECDSSKCACCEEIKKARSREH